MIIKWFPRSWIQIKTTNLVIHIDPSYMSTYFGKYNKKIVFSEAEDDCLPESLEKGDLILVSHIHKDHCKEVTINRLSNKETVILTPNNTKEMDKRVKIVTPESIYHFKNILIETISAYNTDEGSSTRKVHKKGECVGFIINADDKRIYFSGDTDLIPEMKDIKDIDIAVVPIGGTFTMDTNEAFQAIITINPKFVLPVHHLKANPLCFIKKIEENTNINAIALNIGEEFTI